MKIPALNFKLPVFSLFSSQPSAGIVIRKAEVELLAMQGRKVISRVRVPIEGKEDQDLVQAIRKALEESSLKTRRLSVSISRSDVLFRFFNIPVIPRSEWDST